MKASFLFCLLITGVAGAQSVEWFPGIVTLESERVIKGDVSINYLHNVLLLKRKEDKGVSVLPAHKLQHVQYFDAHANKDRKFVSVRQVKNAATENRLLEEVLPGPVPVLRSFYSRKVSLHEEITGHHYYIWFQESHAMIRIDRIITLFGKPGAAYDEYDAFANACMDCSGGD